MTHCVFQSVRDLLLHNGDEATDMDWWLYTSTREMLGIPEYAYTPVLPALHIISCIAQAHWYGLLVSPGAYDLSFWDAYAETSFEKGVTNMLHVWEAEEVSPPYIFFPKRECHAFLATTKPEVDFIFKVKFTRSPL